jgi:hypothetical protein
MKLRDFDFSQIIINSIIWEDNFVPLTENMFIFDELKSEGLQEKHAIVACSLGTISAFA